MKGFTTVLIVIAAFMGVAFMAPTKFGHINSSELIGLMPETKTAQEELEAFIEEVKNQLDEMQVEYNVKLKDYQDNFEKMSDLQKETKEKELSDLQNRAYEFQNSVNQRVQQQQAKLFEPITKKAKDAIKKVGDANGYLYIFDISSGAVIYFSAESSDVTALVKKELGLQ
jgi:outer membrane protein